MNKMRFAGIMIVALLINQKLQAQGSMVDLIKGGKEDANFLLSGYTAPFIKSFGSGLNQGWYNTGDTHNLGGFDLTTSVALISIPTSDKIFSFNNTDLIDIQLDGTTSGQGEIPTFFGDSNPTNKTFSFKDPAIPGTFPDPSGVDVPITKVPVPIANIGIGLPKGIEINIRYLPKMNLGKYGELGLMGLGIKHNIKQYIPVMKSLPFSLSAFVGVTKFNSSIILDQLLDQKVNFNLWSTTAQLLVSKKLSVLTIYGGVGYDITKGNLTLKGSYDLGDGNLPIKDPVDSNQTANSFRGTAGLRLKFGPITLHGDYTLKKYSAITAGFGISVR